MYEKLDQLIINRIAEGARSFIQIDARDVRTEAQRIAVEMGREPFRIVDGRLQALRRAGKVVWMKGLGMGWRVSHE